MGKLMQIVHRDDGNHAIQQLERELAIWGIFNLLFP